jgi:hypothetical protein
MYGNSCKVIKAEAEQFEDTITQKSFYSISKCQNMKQLVNIYRLMVTFIEGVAKLNELELKKIDISGTKKEDALKTKANQFVKMVAEYSNSEEAYNRNFGEYQQLCSKLNEMMGKFKTFENPINFYNIHKTSDFSKGLDKKYYECENKETSLISTLQLLDEKRKLLTENLKDIKQDYMILLHSHMLNFTDAAECLTDQTKDDMQENSSIVSLHRARSDVFNEEIQRFDSKYGKGNAIEDEALFSGLKDVFNNNNNNNNCHISITSD